MDGIFTMTATGKSSGKAMGASVCEAKRYWNPKIFIVTLGRVKPTSCMEGVSNYQTNVFDVSDK